MFENIKDYYENYDEKSHVLVNATRIPYFKRTDGAELSNAMVSGRKQAETIFRFMKAFLPGFETHF